MWRKGIKGEVVEGKGWKRRKKWKERGIKINTENGREEIRANSINKGNKRRRCEGEWMEEEEKGERNRVKDQY